MRCRRRDVYVFTAAHWHSVRMHLRVRIRLCSVSVRCTRCGPMRLGSARVSLLWARAPAPVSSKSSCNSSSAACTLSNTLAQFNYQEKTNPIHHHYINTHEPHNIIQTHRRTPIRRTMLNEIRHGAILCSVANGHNGQTCTLCTHDMFIYQARRTECTPLRSTISFSSIASAVPFANRVYMGVGGVFRIPSKV